jgi:hypothetical protein
MGTLGARVRPGPRAVGPRHGATAGTVHVRRRDADAARARRTAEGTRTCAYDQAMPGAVLQPFRAMSWTHVRRAVHGVARRRARALLHCSCFGPCNSCIGGRGGK